MARKSRNAQPYSLVDLIESSDDADAAASAAAGPASVTGTASAAKDLVPATHDAHLDPLATSDSVGGSVTVNTSNTAQVVSTTSTTLGDVNAMLTEPAAPSLAAAATLSTSAQSSQSKPSQRKAATASKASKASSSKALEPFVYPIDPTQFVVCGIDEAGRGPLMGDVVAACVILDHSKMIPGIDDSKHLSEKKRDALAPVIKQYAVAYGIGRASPAEIDELNILHATFLAMRRAYEMMQVNCNLALIDGNKIPPGLNIACQAVVKGDARVKEIGAASILAKTTRDADLYALDQQYPEYKFAQHKGYPTAAHLEVLSKLPILPCYRFSYGPVQKLIRERNLKIMPNHILLPDDGSGE